MSELRIERGTEPGRCFKLSEEAFIGRGRNCSVLVDEQDVSRRHARIFKHKDCYWIEDLDSRNGTSVNGRKIEGPAELSPGDHIRVGRTWISFAADAASDPAKLLQSDFLIEERCKAPYLQYRATQRMLSRRVSLAVFPSAARESHVRNRFLGMLNDRARLDHRNLQVVLDYGIKDEVGYFAAEWLAGPTLASVLDSDQKIDLHETFGIGSSLYDALHQIHENGAIHGGVATETIRLEHDRPVLTEIGLGELTGNLSPNYQPPEGPGSQAADVYSLAVVLACSLLGRNPFAAETQEKTEVLHKTLDRSKLAGELRKVSAKASILAPALATEPATRPPAGELAAQFLQAAGELRAGIGPTTGLATRLRLSILRSRLFCWLLFPALAFGLLLCIAHLTAQ